MANDDLVLIFDDTGGDMVLVDDGPIGHHYDDYTGAYTVSPIFHDSQVLRTYNKHMLDDVTISAIGEQYIPNQYGGLTAIIG